MVGRVATAPRAWLRRWERVLPIFVAEFVLVTGFGAILPILPLYVVEHGVDAATLGVIMAAFPATRLLGDPFFGWLADRTARKPLMLAGCVLMAGLTILPLFFTLPIALIVIRGAMGLAVSMYDPAARGYLVDATEEDERGEVFGIYSAAQMGGIIFGPVIGGVGAALGGGYVFPFLVGGVLSLAGGVYVLVALRDERAHHGALAHGEDGVPRQAPLAALANRMLIGALIMNFGFFFSVGVYEVIWSLFMTHLGASVAWIGFTFVLFGTPMLVLSPFAGRLVDRVGAWPFALVGGLIIAAAGFAYSFATEPYLPAGIILVESTANAFLGPALFSILAFGTPAGRSSTAQGLFGAAGTVGFVISSLPAGWLFSLDPRYPFYFFTGVVVASVLLGAFIARSPTRRVAAPQPEPT
jgi:MFS family permease